MQTDFDRYLSRITIMGDRKEVIDIPCYAWETGVEGLVVTPAVTTHEVIPDRYTLTHEESGWSLLTHHFYSIEVATVFAQRICEGYVDFTAEPMEYLDQLAKKVGKEIPAAKFLEVAVDTDGNAYLNALAEKFEAKVEEDPFAYLPTLEKEVEELGKD